MGSFGFQRQSGRGRAAKYWYGNPSTGLLYEGPKPSAALLRRAEKRAQHPSPDETEPCPWEEITCGNHELIVIPGPPEVLYNKLGLTDAEEVHEREGLGVVRAHRFMQENVTATTPITVPWLRRLHQEAFKGLYTWAGRYRTVRMSKGGKYPFDGWCLPQHIEVQMQEFERQYLRALTPVSPRDQDNVPRRVAILISEFLLIHPFREGNGRIAQMMGDWVALQAGLPPIAYGIDEDSEKKDAYILALHHGYAQNYGPMEEFVKRGIQRALRILRNGPPPQP